MSSAVAVSGSARVPRTDVRGSAPNHSGITVPTFTKTFTFGGTTYSYTMVGSDPTGPPATTVVPTVVLPLRFVFSDGYSLSGQDIVASTLASPIFQPSAFSSGTTQYGDAMQRAMFWQQLGGNDYHVLLGQPDVLPEVTINVPKSKGTYIPTGGLIGQVTHTGVATGVVDDAWFGARFDALVSQLDLPTSLPILLSRNVVLAAKPFSSNCCTNGWHSVTPSVRGNGNQKILTSIWSNYGDGSNFAEDPTFGRNVDILSHEVAEWLADPMGSNIVPPWSSPLAPWYGCSPYLEVGDPLVGTSFQQDGYQLQDEAFVSWFTHQQPSVGISGQYSYLGTLTSPPSVC